MDLNVRPCVLLLTIGAILRNGGGLGAADCNGNGIDDPHDLSPTFGLLSGEAYHLAVADSIRASMIAIDIEGDGKRELVTTNYELDSLSVFSVQGENTLAHSMDLVVGHRPQCVIAADLNGDGNLDLATANAGDHCANTPTLGTVSVLLNHGNGTFGDAVTYTVEGSPGLAVAADLNGDGKADLATVNSGYQCGSPDAKLPGTVSVFLNQGNGIFRDAGRYTVENHSGSLVAADFNGDGTLDLVAAHPLSHTVAVLLNKGDGTFADAVSYAGGGNSLVAADFNGDGNMDLCSNPSWAISVLLNQGDGVLGDAVYYGLNGYAGRPIVADLDGDGAPDVAAAGTNEVFILLNQGDGMFRQALAHPYPGGFNIMMAADLDGDGNMDLATANRQGTFSVLVNKGDGMFDTVSYAGAAAGGYSAVATDLNGDGMSDLAIAGYRDISVLYNNGGGSFRAALGFSGGGQFLVATDLDGDGTTDVATAQRAGIGDDGVPVGPGTFSVVINRGDGPFIRKESYTIGSTPASLIVTDLNGDGGPDAATVDIESKDVSVLLNEGDGHFVAAANYSIDGAPISLVAADFNGDGYPDLASSKVSSEVSLLVNNGDGTFGAPVNSWGATGGLSRASLVAGDFDRDGQLDLAAASDGDDRVATLLNRGDGTFSSKSYSVKQGDARGSLIAGDLNGDGVLDLATDGVSVLLNRGDGTFDDSVAFPAHGASLVVADFNSDGMPDMATGGIQVLINSGDGKFAPSKVYPAPGSNLIVADFDGDGKRDLATNAISVIINKGDGTFLGAMGYVPGGDPLMSTDFNGDGKTDIATSNDDAIFLFLNETQPPYSHDTNYNAIPDECETRFHRGDPNANGATDISDGIAIFEFLFLGAEAPTCNESADTNNDGTVDIADGIYLLSWLFRGGPEPAAPGPTGARCGLDPDAPGSPGDIGCEGYSGCD